jgi:hypothetical protein
MCSFFYAIHELILSPAKRCLITEFCNNKLFNIKIFLKNRAYIFGITNEHAFPAMA